MLGSLLENYQHSNEANTIFNGSEVWLLLGDLETDGLSHKQVLEWRDDLKLKSLHEAWDSLKIHSGWLAGPGVPILSLSYFKFHPFWQLRQLVPRFCKFRLGFLGWFCHHGHGSEGVWWGWGILASLTSGLQSQVYGILVTVRLGKSDPFGRVLRICLGGRLGGLSRLILFFTTGLVLGRESSLFQNQISTTKRETCPVAAIKVSLSEVWENCKNSPQRLTNGQEITGHLEESQR